MPHLTPSAKLASTCLACLVGLALSQSAVADWNWTNLSNPNWDISLTDAGYSDYLLDHTPGFEGREYLSGEWGAAIGYTKGASTVTPTWLEPMFSFPDWQTNSNFVTETPMAITGYNADNLPMARSVLNNGDLRITQTIEIVDTQIGTPMGTSAASSGGAGSSRMSNRYVMLQSYSVENISGVTIDNVQLFQLLHGLHSQSGVYDNRNYSGPLSNYQYDVTLGGVDPYSSGGQIDYISFHSSVAPTAFEIGRYGIEGIDDHATTGKPSEGTHLSIEGNSLNNVDSFTPADRWVAGAERWDMGPINAGETRSMNVMLSILTGWQVDSGTDSGSVNGGATSPGGIDYEFLGDHSDGQFFVSYDIEDMDGIAEMVDLGEFGVPTFQTPGDQLQIFEVEFEGTFDTLKLTFAYDAGLLTPGFDEEDLHVFHWIGDEWVDLGGTVDTTNHTITAFTTDLSPFAIAAVPEPETYAMLLAGLGLVGVAARRRKSSGA
jgi:hypothetical protein